MANEKIRVNRIQSNSKGRKLDDETNVTNWTGKGDS